MNEVGAHEPCAPLPPLPLLAPPAFGGGGLLGGMRGMGFPGMMGMGMGMGGGGGGGYQVSDM